MKVDVTSLGMPLHYLAKCGIYFSAYLDAPFMYVTKETVSNTYPYRCLFYDGVIGYIEEWTQKDLAKKAGTFLDGYKISFNSFNFYNGIFAVANHSKFDAQEEADFMHNVKVVMKWQKRSALIRKLKSLDDLLR